MSDMKDDIAPSQPKTMGDKARNLKKRLSLKANEVKASAISRMTMTGEIKNAVETLNQLARPDFAVMKATEERIPLKILQKACGLAFITEVKAGFLFSGKGGTGIVIKKLGKGEWSGPSCFGFAGVGAGLMVGMSKTNTIVVLNTPEAVEVFMSKGQIKLGADLEVTAGPLGRDIGGEARFGSEKKVCASYSYSHSKGLYAGVSIDGSVLATKKGVNSEFYGEEITPADILSGKAQCPQTEELKELYTLLNRLGKVSVDDVANEVRNKAASVTGSVKKAGAKAAMGL